MTDGIKIWAVGERHAMELPTVDQFNNELGLEDLLVSNPDLLDPGLTLVGRQTRTKGGPLDLLGVDSNGRLVVYELKRGTLRRDAVTQALDYGSALNAMELDELQKHIQEQSKGAGTGIEPMEDFGHWYAEQHAAWGDDSASGLDDLAQLLPPRLVLVGVGVDSDTERIVRFVGSDHVDISVVSFQAFDKEGQMLLARKVEVDSEASPPAGSAKRTRASDRRKVLSSLLEKHDLTKLFDAIDRSIHDWLPAGRKSRAQTDSGARFTILTSTAHQGKRKTDAGFVVSLGDTDPPSLTIRICSWPAEEASRELEELRAKVDLRDASHGAKVFAVKDAEDWRRAQGPFAALVRAATAQEAR